MLLLLLVMLLMLVLAVLLLRMVLLLVLALPAFPPGPELPPCTPTPTTRSLASEVGFRPDRSSKLFQSGGIGTDDDDDVTAVNTLDTGDKLLIDCWAFKSFSSLKLGIFKSPLPPPFPINSFNRMASTRWLGSLLCDCILCCWCM